MAYRFYRHLPHYSVASISFKHRFGHGHHTQRSFGLSGLVCVGNENLRKDGPWGRPAAPEVFTGGSGAGSGDEFCGGHGSTDDGLFMALVGAEEERSIILWKLLAAFSSCLFSRSNSRFRCSNSWSCLCKLSMRASLDLSSDEEDLCTIACLGDGETLGLWGFILPVVRAGGERMLGEARRVLW
mmetsp:Transcript_72237/g.120930  ORF Transcript_72237/g.120930 Transcript_72237/m.120930 type:complete len:184 (+) Transcript_72237:118-669(+)